MKIIIIIITYTKIYFIENDILFCVAYIPPENSPFYIKRSQDTLEFIEQDIMMYKRVGKIIVTGDLNARTRYELDFIQQDHLCVNTEESYTPDIDIITRDNGMISI